MSSHRVTHIYPIEPHSDNYVVLEHFTFIERGRYSFCGQSGPIFQEEVDKLIAQKEIVAIKKCFWYYDTFGSVEDQDLFLSPEGNVVVARWDLRDVDPDKKVYGCLDDLVV